MEQNGGNQNMSSTIMLCRTGCGFYGSPAFEGMCSKCYKDVLQRRQQNSSPNGLISPSAVAVSSSVLDSNMRAINISQNHNTDSDDNSHQTPPTPDTSTTPSVNTASPTVITIPAASANATTTPTIPLQQNTTTDTANATTGTTASTQASGEAAAANTSSQNHKSGDNDQQPTDDGGLVKKKESSQYLKVPNGEAEATSPSSSIGPSPSPSGGSVICKISRKRPVASTDDDDQSPGQGPKKPKKNRCHVCKKKVGLTGFQCRCNGLYCSLHRYSDKHDCQFDYKELAQTEIRKQNPVIVGEKVKKI